MQLLYRDRQNNFIEVDLPSEGGIIGYGTENFITLDAVGISEKHLRLSADEDRLYVEDLNSLNGTYLNRRRLSEKKPLSDGDRIQIGLLQLRFSKEFNRWAMTAETPEKSLFVVDGYQTTEPQESAEEFSTAVTVIASPGIRAAIKSGDISALQPLETSQNTNVTNRGRFSLENLKELGKYRIVKKIGRGGMGIVFLARHKVFDSYRTLKVLPHYVKEENCDFYERFMREARIAFDIRHPNIVGVMDAEADVEQGVSYIVMEFIDGGNLRRILKIQKQLPEIQGLLIARGIASALKGIAEHNIIHRDIKPDNIMFTRHGDVKLADLGIAKNDSAGNDVNITQSDAMIGTPAYLSPEQIENPKGVDIRSDIYSLGATLYEMLTGTPPYTGKNTYDIVHKMLSESIPDPRSKNPQISSIAAQIVMKMLQKNPAKRYQTPQELINVLDRILPHYSDNKVQEIIKSAVLGTALPKGVRGDLNSGVGTLISFRFFNSWRSRDTQVQKGEKGNSPDPVIMDFDMPLFSLKTEQEKISVSALSAEIRTIPDTEFKLTSSKGYSAVVKSDSRGVVKVTDIPPGEYFLSEFGNMKK
ncbi:MAG: protein kinase [Lentisphaeria bacterium]|nr:protein kinase [Lentisphaeria bacterium]